MIIKIENDISKVKDILKIGEIYRKKNYLGFVPIKGLYNAINNGKIITLYNNDENNELIGYLYFILRTRKLPLNIKNAIEIKHIVIKDGYTNKGYGTTMINFINDNIIINDNKYIIVNVNIINKIAIDFYIKNNFIILNKKMLRSGRDVLQMILYL